MCIWFPLLKPALIGPFPSTSVLITHLLWELFVLTTWDCLPKTCCTFACLCLSSGVQRSTTFYLISLFWIRCQVNSVTDEEVRGINLWAANKRRQIYSRGNGASYRDTRQIMLLRNKRWECFTFGHSGIRMLFFATTVTIIKGGLCHTNWIFPPREGKRKKWPAARKQLTWLTKTRGKLSIQEHTEVLTRKPRNKVDRQLKWLRS